MAKPIPYDTYMVNIDETETRFPLFGGEDIINSAPLAAPRKYPYI